MPTEEGGYHLAWSKPSRPGLSLTIDVLPNGQLEWFFRDEDGRVVLGTEEEPEPELPQKVLELAAHFAG
jgi:hypothetical protein